MMPSALRFALGFSLALGLASAAQAAEGARPPFKEVHFSFEGPLGKYDRGALQRGFQVYKEVCAACHSFKHVAFRNLADHGGPGFTPAQARAIAAEYKVAAGPDDKGETTNEDGTPRTRQALLSDYFPAPYPNDEAARANNGGALPPDLSMVVKARLGEAHYVYSLLTGYGAKPPHGLQVAEGKYYNPYYPGATISMPPPLRNDGVTFSDGTKATVEQQAHDVVTFLAWASDPKMEQRKQMGFSVIIFLLVLAGLLYMSYRKVWADLH